MSAAQRDREAYDAEVAQAVALSRELNGQPLDTPFKYHRDGRVALMRRCTAETFARRQLGVIVDREDFDAAQRRQAEMREISHALGRKLTAEEALDVAAALAAGRQPALVETEEYRQAREKRQRADEDRIIAQARQQKIAEAAAQRERRMQEHAAREAAAAREQREAVARAREAQRQRELLEARELLG